jgi:hypothetical protein
MSSNESVTQILGRDHVAHMKGADVGLSTRRAPRSFFFLVAVLLSGLATEGASADRVANDFGTESPSAIISAARAEMTLEGSFMVTSRSATTINKTPVVVAGTGWVGRNSGSQEVTYSYAPGHTGPALPSGITLDVAGTVYFKGNAQYLEDYANLSAATATQAANQWIRIPSTSDLYHEALIDLTLPSFMHDFFDATVFRKGTSAGSYINISYTNIGVDGGEATCSVALAGKHLPRTINIGSGVTSFSHWGVKPPLAMPAATLTLTG